jgi:zinc protease
LHLSGLFGYKGNGGFVVSTPEEDLRIAEIALDSITSEVLQEVFRNSWDTEDINIYLFNRQHQWYSGGECPTPHESLFGQPRSASRSTSGERAGVFTYTEFGSPGMVMEDLFVPDLGIWQMALSNGVRVNMKQTDFEAGVLSAL